MSSSRFTHFNIINGGFNARVESVDTQDGFDTSSNSKMTVTAGIRLQKPSNTGSFVTVVINGGDKPDFDKATVIKPALNGQRGQRDVITYDNLDQGIRENGQTSCVSFSNGGTRITSSWLENNSVSFPLMDPVRSFCIIVHNQANSRRRQFKVTGSDTVDHLKLLIRNECGLNFEEQQLVFAGKNLASGMTLQHYGIREGSKIFLTCRMQCHSDSTLSRNILLRQSSVGGAKLSELPTDKIISLLENELGRHSVAELRKTQDGVVISINKTAKTTSLLQTITQQEKADIKLPNGISVEATRHRTVKWVIKRVKTHLSNDQVREMLSRENSTLKIASVERIIKNDIPSTAVIITPQDRIIPQTVRWDREEQVPELYFPRVAQCSKCQKFWHTRATCKSVVEVCRYCSRLHPYDQCHLAKIDTDFGRPNYNRRCANCLGNHSARYHGCPCYRDSMEVMKIAVNAALPYKEARRQYKATTRLPNRDKAQLEGQLKDLRLKITSMEEKRDQAQETQITAVQRILNEVKQVQQKIEQDVARMAAIKAETEETLNKIEEEREQIERRKTKNETSETEDIKSQTEEEATDEDVDEEEGNQNDSDQEWTVARRRYYSPPRSSYQAVHDTRYQRRPSTKIDPDGEINGNLRRDSW